MPKKTHIISRFDGGINEESNPRDLEIHELVSAKDVAVDNVGKVKTTPYSASNEATITNILQVFGDGIFLFSTDYLRAESATQSVTDDTGDDYVAMADKESSGGIRILSRTNGSDSSGTNPIQFSDNADIQPNYFIADGGLRVCDGNFDTTENDSRWYGYIKRDLFPNNTANKYSIDGWKHEKVNIETPSTSSSLKSGTSVSSIVSYNDETDVSTATNNDTSYTSNSNAVDSDDGTITKSKGDLGFTGGQNYVNSVRIRLKVTGYDDDNWMITSALRVGAQNSTSFQSTGYAYHSFSLEQIIDQFDGYPMSTEDIYEYTFTFPDSGLDISTNSLRVSLRTLTNDSGGTVKIDSIYVEGGTGIGDTSYNQSPNSIDVTIGDSATAGADWVGDWNVGVSFVYDGVQESLVQKLSTQSGGDTVTLTKAPYTNVGFNFTTSWNQRITGTNIYVKKEDETDWKLHAIVDMTDGTIQRYDDPQKFYSAYSVANTGFLFNLKGEVSVNIPFITYESSAGYSQSLNTLNARYKTAVIANRRSYVANVMVKDKSGTYIKYADRIIKSAPNKFDVLPLENSLEVTVNDGESITALMEYGDKLLQFKERTLYIINISGQFEFNEGVFHFRGIKNKAQVCKTDIGIAWVNENGCFLFDGKQIRDLLEKRGKRLIKKSTWASFVSEKSMIVYQPDLQQIIIVKSYGTESDGGDAYIFDLVTNSWVYKNDFLASSLNKTNVINDWDGKISYCTQVQTSSIFKQVVQSETAQSGFELITPDIDFGNPATRKNIYEVQVSYKGGTSQNVTVAYDTDGANSFSTSFSTVLNSTSANQTTTTLAPTSIIEDAKSFQLKFTGTIATGFEINDVSIVYREKRVI